MTTFWSLLCFTHLVVTFTAQSSSNYLTVFWGAADAVLLHVHRFFPLQKINQSFNFIDQFLLLLVLIALWVISLDLFYDDLAILKHDISSGYYISLSRLNFLILNLFCNYRLWFHLLFLNHFPKIVENAMVQEIWGNYSVSVCLIQLKLDSRAFVVSHFFINPI